MNQAVQETPKAKAKTEYHKVHTEDGRVVEIPVSRRYKAEFTENESGDVTGLRYDFVNGATRSLLLANIPLQAYAWLAAHGAKQKTGDRWANSKDEQGNPISVEDIVLSCEEMFDRLQRGEVLTERAPGDSMAGASVVIQALCAVYNKTAAEVKAILEKKLAAMTEEAAEKGEDPPTKQRLYASYRKVPKIAAEIRKIEEARAEKQSVGSSEELLEGFED